MPELYHVIYKNLSKILVIQTSRKNERRLKECLKDVRKNGIPLRRLLCKVCCSCHTLFTLVFSFYPARWVF